MLKAIFLTILIMFFPLSATAVCKGQCLQCKDECVKDNYFLVNKDGKFNDEPVTSNELGKRRHLRYVCQARCGQDACLSKPIAEYMAEFNSSDFMPRCLANDLSDQYKQRRDAKVDKEMEGLRSARKEYEAAKRNYEDSIQRQPAPQSTTQTSQNNSPSDSTSGQSRPDSSARHDNTNYGNCISVTSEKNRYVVYKNNCSENLTLLLCQVSDGQGSEDSYSRFQDGGSCPSPGFGAVDIKAGATHKKAEWFDFNNYRFFYYACKTGWIPVNESGKYVTRINESFLCKN